MIRFLLRFFRKRRELVYRFADCLAQQRREFK